MGSGMADTDVGLSDSGYSDSGSAAGTGSEIEPRSSWPLWSGMGLGVIVFVGLALALVLSGNRGDRSGVSEVVAVETSSGHEKVNYDFVIPYGTAARIAAGENINIIPDRLRVRVGDTMRVRNDDAKAAQVGFFRVNPGETVTMRFTTPGRFEDKCDVRAQGNQVFIIDVSA